MVIYSQPSEREREINKEKIQIHVTTTKDTDKTVILNRKYFHSTNNKLCQQIDRQSIHMNPRCIRYYQVVKSHLPSAER